jgi:predicted patatin/cPLA2 family phospholipase
MKKILVLSGGGAFGCFEMAVVSALIIEGKGSWDLITGVSAGSFNASYLSTIEKDKEIDNIDLFKKLWCDINNSLVFQNEYFLNGLSVYNSDKYKQTVKSIYDDKLPLRPVMISATSLNSSSSRIFRNKDIEEYGFTDIVMSSSSIPILFQPYFFLNEFFIDGGFTSNILLDESINYCLKNFPNEEVQIDVIVCSKKLNPEIIDKSNLNITKLIEKLIGIVEQQVEYFEIMKNIKTPSNITVKVYEPINKPDISFLNFDKSEDLWNYGFDLSNINIYELPKESEIQSCNIL